MCTSSRRVVLYSLTHKLLYNNAVVTDSTAGDLYDSKGKGKDKDNVDLYSA